MAVTPDLAGLIRRVPLFSELPEDETTELLRVVELCQAPAGALILREGERGDCLYVVQTGEVEIVKALGSPDERSIGLHGPGSFFGEMSLLDPSGLRMASARARCDSTLWRMGRAEFDHLLETRPRLAHEMLRVVSLRLTETHSTTIADLRDRNRRLEQAYEELRAAQAELIEKGKLERELQVAHQIQQSILPDSVPAMLGFEFGVRMVPARAVGGDLFDFVPLGPDKQGIMIGDVSGKGVPAAIFMGLTRALVRAEAGRATSPAETLQSVNRLLLDMNNADMFVTLLYGVLDGAASTFTFVRAGHEPPLLLGSDGAVEELDQGKGMLLGLFPNPALDELTVTLPPGSSLLLYTDGATDIRCPAGDRYELERLQATAQALAGRGAQAFCDSLWDTLAGFQSGEPQADDVCLLAIRAQSTS